jgi:hypothetical protein
MDKLALIDSFLHKIPDDQVFGNTDYKNELEVLYSKRSTEQEASTIQLLINFIDNNREKCFDITAIIYSNSSVNFNIKL